MIARRPLARPAWRSSRRPFVAVGILLALAAASFSALPHAAANARAAAKIDPKGVLKYAADLTTVGGGGFPIELDPIKMPSGTYPGRQDDQAEAPEGREVPGQHAVQRAGGQGEPRSQPGRRERRHVTTVLQARLQEPRLGRRGGCRRGALAPEDAEHRGILRAAARQGVVRRFTDRRPEGR